MPLPSASAPREVRVWDPLVRGFHWLVVVAFAIAYLTEGEPLFLHSWAGYAIAIAVALRVIWGFVGPRHARFTDFVHGPRTVLAYLGALVTLRAPRHLGHSPAGGAMVVALLVALAATSVTGMLTLAQQRDAGPLAPWFGWRGSIVAAPDLPARSRIGEARRDEASSADHDRSESRTRGDRRRSPLKGVHELLANITLALVGFHLVGVALASLVHRENLPRAMITGRKRA